MTDEELADLIVSLRRAGTDVAGVEVKRARTGVPSSLVETLSAFSNSPGGGIAILGLDEGQNFAAVGVADAATMLSKVQGLCADSMEPPVRPLIQLHEVDGAYLIVMELPELPTDQKPCFYKGRGRNNGSYRRVGDGDYRMTPYEVSQVIAARGQPRDDTAAVTDARRSDLDPASVGALLARVGQRQPSFAEEDESTALRRLRVITPHPDSPDVDVPTLAGLLCVGRHPQDFYPQLNLTFVHYPTAEGATADMRFIDNRALEGSIPVIVRDALATLRANMSRGSSVRGAGREDTWEYPEQALREALVNALVHRDYSAMSLGSQVQVEMYPDRLVVRSPGGLFGPVTVDRLGEPGVSSTRNSTLLRLLEDTTIPGELGAVCENRGSGIPAMVRTMRTAGLTLPSFDDRLSCFEVTFPNHTLLDPDAVQWLTNLEQGELSDSQAEALVLMRRGVTFTNLAYRNRFLLDSRVATAELGDLTHRRLVEAAGARRWTTYTLAPHVLEKKTPASAVLALAGPRRVLQSLVDGSVLTRAEIADRVAGKDRAVIDWLRRLRTADPALIERVGRERSPETAYRITDAGIAALETAE